MNLRLELMKNRWTSTERTVFTPRVFSADISKGIDTLGGFGGEGIYLVTMFSQIRLHRAILQSELTPDLVPVVYRYFDGNLYRDPSAYVWDQEMFPNNGDLIVREDDFREFLTGEKGKKWIVHFETKQDLIDIITFSHYGNDTAIQECIHKFLKVPPYEYT